MTLRERKLFGTDGVRDLANAGRMTPEIALSLGRAFVKAHKVGKVVVGIDTRLSCRMLEGALVSGLSSEGADVYICGIIPTPAVSYAVKALNADGGAVISASHNPAEYNGIKFLGTDGSKLSDAEELAIECMLYTEPNTSPNIGRVHDCPELVDAYAKHIASLLKPGAASDNTAFDCANGASALSVPHLVNQSEFSALNTHIISTDYDGTNINTHCGTTHMERLTSYVKDKGLSIGFAFDGDADRVLISDKYGRVIDGDIILWTLARWMKTQPIPGNDKVVATVMSNMALETHLAKLDIQTLRCPVGDRHVLELMRETGAALGGEQSGHIIARPYTSTGDGLCTAMLFLNAIHDLGEDISELIDRFGRYPQTLTNLTLTRPREAVNMKAIDAIVSGYSMRVKGGRIFIRTSGTEPLLRILVEAPEREVVDEVSRELSTKLMEFC